MSGDACHTRHDTPLRNMKPQTIPRLFKNSGVKTVTAIVFKLLTVFKKNNTKADIVLHQPKNFVKNIGTSKIETSDLLHFYPEMQF